MSLISPVAKKTRIIVVVVLIETEKIFRNHKKLIKINNKLFQIMLMNNEKQSITAPPI